MSKRYTETELEKIVRIGCARIDQAVERVCAKYEAPFIPPWWYQGLTIRIDSRGYIVGLGCADKG